MTGLFPTLGVQATHHHVLKNHWPHTPELFYMGEPEIGDSLQGPEGVRILKLTENGRRACEARNMFGSDHVWYSKRSIIIHWLGGLGRSLRTDQSDGFISVWRLAILDISYNRY